MSLTLYVLLRYDSCPRDQGDGTSREPLWMTVASKQPKKQTLKEASKEGKYSLFYEFRLFTDPSIGLELNTDESNYPQAEISYLDTYETNLHNS